MSTLGWLAVLTLGLGPVSVRLDAPPECPTARDVEADIEGLLDRPPVVDVTVDVTQAGEAFVATVEYQAEGAALARTIPGPDCRSVLDAVALVVAVGVDPLEVQRMVAPALQRSTEAVPEPLPPPTLPPTALAPQPTAPAPSVSPKPESARRPAFARAVEVFARGGATTGLLADVAGWAGGGAALSFGSARLEAWGRHQFARRVEQASFPGVGADVALSSGALAACWTPSVGRFTIGACGGLEAGAVVGRGRGLQSPLVARDLWLAATPGIRARWAVHPRVQLGALVDVPISLRKPLFSIDDFDAPLVQVGAAGVFAGLSVAVIFFDESPSSRR
ncbi:MAG: hypothetical protein AAGA54_06960 [Myxococcota bacterium]